MVEQLLNWGVQQAPAILALGVVSWRLERMLEKCFSNTSMILERLLDELCEDDVNG